MNLSHEQQIAMDLFKEGKNLFITGPGGSGKSTLIREMVHYLEFNQKNYQVCAMTGCAAVLLKCRARTLHSWAGMGIANGPENKIIDKMIRNKKIAKVWKHTHVLIVDEVSMMSCKIFNIIESAARIIKQKYHLPFGGMQVIFTGDFYQLPPVGTPGEEDTSKFCFESERWNVAFPFQQHILLQQIFRQQGDETFQTILNEVRVGNISETSLNILKNQVGKKYQNEIPPVQIFPTRAKVDYVNKFMYDKLTDGEYVFEFQVCKNAAVYIDSGKMIEHEKLIECESFLPEDVEREIENLMNNHHRIKLLKLKVNTKVMCVHNIDVESGICNGSIGIVTKFQSEHLGGKEYPVVKFSNGVDMLMKPQPIQSETMPNIVITQIPLIKAWALTIHKMQGATLDSAEIDIGSSIFEKGQVYVALSRVKTLDGLYIKSLNANRIQKSEIVQTYMNKIMDSYRKK